VHPRNAALIAFCDAEVDANRSRRIATHLSKCEKCRQQTQLIQAEKSMLSAGDGRLAMNAGAGLNGVLSAMAAWQRGTTSAASQLSDRLRWQLQTYFGAPAVRAVERPGMRPEELLGKGSEMLEVFLGASAAEVLIDDVVRELDWTATAGERWQ
jgi:hypothetical protein